MKKASYSKRGLIRQILNRKKNYLLATYVRLISKRMGRSYKASDIVNSLKGMQREHRIHFSIKGKRIYGRVLATAFI